MMNISGVVPGALTVAGATAIGAGGVFVLKRLSGLLHATIVAGCAGMMTFCAVEMMIEAHSLAGHRVAFTSLLVGLAVFALLDRLLPHAHLALVGAELPPVKRKAALLISAMTLHNIPEGFAVAAAFADSVSLGWLVTLCIASQDIPEGLVVAAPIACHGAPAWRCFLWGLFSGLVEAAAAIGGFLFLRAVTAVTPAALGFSAGTMAYVTFFELLPDAFRVERRQRVMLAFVIGCAVAFGMAILAGRYTSFST
jgi:ZIP family zinc transporter